MINSEQAEKEVLSAILLNPDALLVASDIIEPSDFYYMKNRIIYDCCLDLYQLGETIDNISLSERLKTKYNQVLTGYISTLIADAITSANISYHSKIVKQKALLRKIKNWSLLISEEIDSIDDIPAFLGKIEKDIVDIAQEIRERKSPQIKEILQKIRNDWNAEKSDYIPCDWKFDPLIPGKFPGHLWIIGGYTSVGKTSLLAQMVVDDCEENAGVLIFSTEDSRKDKAMRILGNLSDVTQRKLILGDIEQFRDRISEANRKMTDWNLIIYDDIYTIEEIRLKAKKHKLQNSINILYLDFIQNLQGYGTIYERMSSAISKLQQLAKELQITVIALSQVSNEAMRTDTEIIGLKGAGELAAAADIVLWLKRVKNQDSFLDCEIRKNRPFGQTGIIPLRFSEFWTKVERRGL